MQRTLILTKDGSHTVSVPELNVTYHSIHGAIQESLHVFIHAGFDKVDMRETGQTTRIFEIGFGTGLNALLTCIEAEKKRQRVEYIAIEPFPLEFSQAQLLNYCQQLSREELQPVFEKLHEAEWEKETGIGDFFAFYKSTKSLLTIAPSTFKPFHLIYFDAFAPSAQPELWTTEVFEKLYAMLHPGGSLLTYCSKGDVRRAMQAAGLTVVKIPGPPGKREMVRAEKKIERIL